MKNKNFYFENAKVLKNKDLTKKLSNWALTI